MDIEKIKLIPYSEELEEQLLIDSILKERKAIEHIESETLKLLEYSKSVDSLVNSQSYSIDTIENNIVDTSKFVYKSESELVQANDQQYKYRGKIIGSAIGAIGMTGTAIATFGLSIPVIVGTSIGGSLLGAYLGYVYTS